MADKEPTRSNRPQTSAARGRVSSLIFAIPTFSALRFRDFRFFFLAVASHASTMHIESVARSWLVWVLSGSGIALGVVNSFLSMPLIIFPAIGGVAADRFNKRLVVILAGATEMTYIFILAALIIGERIQLWHLYAAAFVHGVAISFNQPTRQAMIPMLVEAGDLLNAFSLNAMAMAVLRIVVPAAGGILIGIIGIGGTYLVEGTMFMAFILFIWLMVLPPTEAKHRPPPWGQLGEGLAYLWRERLILGLALLECGAMFLGMPYFTILPMVAAQVLGIGAAGFGVLVSASGIGATLASVVLASIGDFRHKGWLLLAGGCCFGTFLLLLSFSRWFWLSLLAMTGVGIAQVVLTTVGNTAILERVPPALHGRVMGVIMLHRGLGPIDSMAIGILAQVLGAPRALALQGIALFVFASGMVLGFPQIVRME